MMMMMMMTGTEMSMFTIGIYIIRSDSQSLSVHEKDLSQAPRCYYNSADLILA